MEMLRFANQEYLYGLFLVPVFLVAFILLLRWKQKALRNFGHEATVKQMITGWPKYRSQVKFLFTMVALAFLCLGMANLQYGTKTKEIDREGVDVMVALDLSKSMKAEDVNPSRLRIAKQFISELLNNMANDRIGLIVFAGNAYVQMPLTVDYAAARMFLNSLNTEIVPTQGTAIGDAISQGLDAFEGGEEKGNHKTMVIISDGENHQGDAVEEAQKAMERSIMINTVGVGTAEGGPIPVSKRGGRKGFVKNSQGEVVVSKMDEGMLTNIAEEGGGAYIHLNNIQESVDQLLEQFNKMEERQIDSTVYTDYSDQFQYFLAVALFFMVVEWLVAERSHKGLINLKF